MDADGYITVVDRLKDMIISGGENVYSTEVETALSTHPAIAQCAVIALPDDKWGRTRPPMLICRAELRDVEEMLAECGISNQGSL